MGRRQLETMYGSCLDCCKDLKRLFSGFIIFVDTSNRET